MSDKITQLRARLMHGVAPALATPLQKDGYTVNTAVTHQLIDFLAARKTTGVLIGGTTGEGIMLSLTERKRLHEAGIAACKAQNRPYISLTHVGTNTVKDTIDLTQHAIEHSTDAILVLCPYFLKLTDNDLFAYFRHISQIAGDTPMMVYDIPHLAINGISPALLTRLETLPNFAGIKCSGRDGQIIRALIHALPEGKIFLAGNEKIALGTLAMGAHGMISGLSTAIPEPFVDLCQAVGRGDLAAAQIAHAQINTILTMYDAPHRIGSIKHLLEERGVPVGKPIPPRAAVTTSYWPAIANYLQITD